MKNQTVIARAASACSKAAGLADRIAKAQTLAFAYADEKLVGVGGLHAVALKFGMLRGAFPEQFPHWQRPSACEPGTRERTGTSSGTERRKLVGDIS